MSTKIDRIIVFLLIFVISFTTVPAILAQSSSKTIDARVKISICGNQSVEGGEDCEGTNLNGKSCSSIGFTGGTLQCDTACTYDVSACTVDSFSKVESPFNDRSDLTPSPTSSGSQPSSVSSISPVLAEILPISLQLFDINGEGKLTEAELPSIVRLWVDEWKKALAENFSNSNNTSRSTDTKKCDINNDDDCNLYDFSVLMYYIEK